MIAGLSCASILNPTANERLGGLIRRRQFQNGLKPRLKRSSSCLNVVPDQCFSLALWAAPLSFLLFVASECYFKIYGENSNRTNQENTNTKDSILTQLNTDDKFAPEELIQSGTWGGAGSNTRSQPPKRGDTGGQNQASIISRNKIAQGYSQLTPFGKLMARLCLMFMSVVLLNSVAILFRELRSKQRWHARTIFNNVKNASNTNGQYTTQFPTMDHPED